MKVAIIGAGLAGLASARRVIQYNMECIIFEAGSQIGGTWVYSDNAHTDKFNNPIHSSIYASVRSYSPAQLMEFEGFPFKPKSGSSHPHYEEVLQYFIDFSKKYDLEKYVKFHHQVIKVVRNSNDWIITVKDLMKNTNFYYIFDAVMLCSGRQMKLILPKIPGMETFTGEQIHSHYYRNNEPYKNKSVLIVGASISAREISMECAKVATKVYLSYRREPPDTVLPKYIVIKPQSSQIFGNKVNFVDGTSIHVDSIINCTGYSHDLSILDSSCGIEVIKDEIIKPLYHMFINCTHPSMCILGIARYTMAWPVADMQAETFAKNLAGIISLPPKEVMLQAFFEDYEKKLKKDAKACDFYKLKQNTRRYLEMLADMGDLKPLPEVKYHIMQHMINQMVKDYSTFKEVTYKIIDDEKYIFYGPNMK